MIQAHNIIYVIQPYLMYIPDDMILLFGDGQCYILDTVLYNNI